ncbi:uncharacterized protein LOC144283352 [Canis aureus]
MWQEGGNLAETRWPGYGLLSPGPCLPIAIRSRWVLRVTSLLPAGQGPQALFIIDSRRNALVSGAEQDYEASAELEKLAVLCSVVSRGQPKGDITTEPRERGIQSPHCGAGPSWREQWPFLLTVHGPLVPQRSCRGKPRLASSGVAYRVQCPVMQGIKSLGAQGPAQAKEPAQK